MISDAELEWANYAAMSESAAVTPGLEVILREDVILTSSEMLPVPDANHACLLRADERTVDGLLDEVTAYFRDKGLPVTVFTSPACTPPDLTERLAARGFVRQEGEEVWMVLENLPDFPIPPLLPGVEVSLVGEGEVVTFAEIFLASFGLPTDFAPYLAQLLAPSVGLSAVRHYVALADGRPAGVCSLLRHDDIGILGSAGVLPEYRQGGVATNLAIQAGLDAQREGVKTLVLQTAGGTFLERVLLANGFRRAFVRECYVLP